MTTLRRERIQKFTGLLVDFLSNSPAVLDVTGDADLLDAEVAKFAQSLADAAASRSELQGSYIKGIEAAIFADRTVTESDLPQGDEAMKAFERDMHCPGSWNWYPAKSSDEPAWKALREFVVKIYQSDNAAFAKYYTWTQNPYSRGAMTVLGIKRNPQDFELSWAAFDASRIKDEAKTIVKRDNGGMPESW